MAGARVKICGINSAAAYDAASTADWVGFVFYAPSPRAVTGAQAAALIRRDGPTPVGLFVEPSDAEIEAVLAAAPLAVLQVIAPPGRAADIRQRFGLPVWRATGVSSAGDLPASMEGADAILLDARPPTERALPGGNAVAFDWDVLRGWQAPGPWLLAGGLTPDNVGMAIDRTGARAVDVSSGVESQRGVKDPDKIRAFLKTVGGV